MVRDIDSSYILYGLGTVLGIFSIFYFGWEILLSLSPTVKSMILFVSFVFFLVAGLQVGKDVINTVFTVLAGGAYLMFLGYTTFRFRPDTNEVFLLLAFSSVLFIGLGYVIREREELLERVSNRYVLVGCIVFVLLLITVDVVGPQASVESQFNEQVNVSGAAQDEVVLGTVTLKNKFLFSRDATVDQYMVCLYAPEKDERVVTRADIGDWSSRQGRSVLLRGGQEQTEQFTARFRAISAEARELENHDRGLTAEDYKQLGTVPVEQAEECPESMEEAKIVVADERKITRSGY